jgi:cell division transport system permease protein
VTSATYVSSQDALAEVRKIFEDERMLDGLEQDNPFPRSFNIELEELRYREEVLLVLEQTDGITNISYAREVAGVALTVSNVIRVVCLVLIIILAAISIVIIMNTIRITVNARHTEISIMKYVGATDWFIRWPFVLEGLLIGLLGGIIPAALCWLGYNRAVVMIREGLPIISFIKLRPGYEIFAYLFPFDLLLGVVIGMFGSLVSVRRHLKV